MSVVPTEAAGKHLILDAYGCQADLSCHETIERIFVEACKTAGATVLFSHSHPFGNGASSGVVILAESHASWHLWIETGYMAIDIFMCGQCEPMVAADEILKRIRPMREVTSTIKRGLKVLDKAT